MKKKDFKKLALLGFTGGVMMGAPEAGAVNAGSDSHLASLSWTQKGHSCGGKNGCGGRTDERGTRGPIADGYDDEQGGGHSCGGQSGCSGSGQRPRGYSNQQGGQYNMPQGGNYNAPPGGQYNAPQGGQYNTPQGGPNGGGMQNNPGYRPNGAPANKNQQPPTGYRTSWNNRYTSDGTDDDTNTNDGSGPSNGPNNRPNKGVQAPTNYRNTYMNRYISEGASTEKVPGSMTDGSMTGEQAMTEEQFARQLSTEGKRIFNSLSAEGKQLAIRLSKQYPDKNQAVKQAAQNLNKQDGLTPGAGASDNLMKRRNLSN